MKSTLKALLFLLIGVILLFLIYFKVNQGYQAQCVLDGIAPQDCSLINKLISDIKSTRFIWLVGMISVYMISNISRTWKWQMLLKPLGYTPGFINTLLAIMIGYFTNLGFPRAGEIIRSGILSKYENIPLEKVVGTVVIDRLTDVLCLLGFIIIACVLAWDKWTGMILDLMKKGKQTSGPDYSTLYYLAGITLSVILVLYLMRHTPFISNLKNRLLQAIAGFKTGLTSISKLENKSAFWVQTIGIWVLYYLMIVFGFKAFGPTASLGFTAALLIFILGGMGMVIPTPGGMGSYHYLVMMGLVSYGLAQAEGFSFAMIMFLTIHLFGNIFFGILSFAILPIYNRQKDE